MPAPTLESARRATEQRQRELNAFIEAWPDAVSSNPAGPLAGFPIAVKDNICTTRGRTTCGSRMLENYRSPYNAQVVDRLEAAGAVIVGKTNLDEFGMGSSTEHSAVGPTRNPINPGYSAGGSSGGSAAAVATGMARAALGSDTGGSVRQPAAMCGVIGLKPTYGRVSRYGLVAYASSLDQIGVIASTVEDVALVLREIAGHDPRDSTSLNEPVPDYVAALQQPARPLRIGVPREYVGEGLNAEVRAAVEKAIKVYRDLGAQIVDITLPHTQACVATYYLIATAEASSNLARFDGIHYGRRAADARDYIDLYAASRSQGLGDEVKLRIMLGTFALSSGYYDAWYGKAQKVRTLIKQDFDAAFEKCDLIAGPTSPVPAFKLGQHAADPLAMYLADIYTVSANLAGIPAISIPCGVTAEGLPVGLQLQARALGEEVLLKAAILFSNVK